MVMTVTPSPSSVPAVCGIVAVIACFALNIIGCHTLRTRRVLVVHPEHWSVGEYRNCALMRTDTVSGLPQLDCDLQASETPRSRMFVMDVEFSGPSGKRLNIDWTCQRSNTSLVCRN